MNRDAVIRAGIAHEKTTLLFIESVESHRTIQTAEVAAQSLKNQLWIMRALRELLGGGEAT